MAQKSSRAKGKSSTSSKSSRRAGTAAQTPSGGTLAVSGDGRKPVEPPHGGIVHLDDERVQHQQDARVGRFARVTKGEHQGRYGVFEEPFDPDKNGYPRKGILTTRDSANERLVVNYKDLEYAPAGGRQAF